MNLKNNRNQMWILALMLGALLLAGVLVACRPDGDVIPPDEGVIPKAVERESVLCATEAGNCVESWNGSDIVMYSGVQSGQTFAIDGATGNLDAGGTFNYGSDDITPLSFDGTTQYEVYFGSASSVTQTTVTSATHNMTTAVDWGMCFVSDPDDDAGDPAYCTISISGSSITFQALDDDGDNAANAATKIYYLIIGQ